MLSKEIIQKNDYFAYRALCAVIHVVWITAFLSLIAFEEILYHTSSCARLFMGAHFLYKQLLRQGLSTLPFSASDFDLPMQLKNQNWRITK